MPTYTAPAIDYCYPTSAYAYCCPPNRCNDFILIVVLFILLIIVGACGYTFYKG
ncbi:YjcZ family sporulation protein [Neobacillus sp. LXY-4]|uniref:YjcZ family sporulation protein n=1 Tax=Neobacillus sp. LXY-4 TaxID=3379826 RepID=UPI003EE17CFC